MVQVFINGAVSLAHRLGTQRGQQPRKALNRSDVYPQISLSLPEATVLCFQPGHFHILLSWGHSVS